jgi:YVTN family beta-propeller protein
MEKVSFRRFLQICAITSVTALAACGGSGTQSSNPAPSSNPDFSLGVSPMNLSVVIGSSNFVTVSDTGENGFSSQVSVQITGLPAGVSASPPSVSLAPGASQVITLLAAAGTSASSGAVTFTGTSGSLTHTASVNLSVSIDTVTGNTPPSRTRYVRMDSTTEYFASLNSHWIVYNPNTSQFYVSDPQSNHVFVLDAATEKQVASISVPGAYGMDDTPNHNTLYVGTEIGDVYAIDTASNTVTNRYMASQIGPNGFQALSALVLSNGSLALLGAAGGIPSVDGSSSLAIWNPTTNSITVYAPPSVVCGSTMENIGGFIRSPDRTEVIIGSIDSDDTLCQINAVTGQGTSVIAVADGSFSTTHITITPNGKYIILPSYPNQVIVYNAQTLKQITAFNVSGDVSSAVGLAVSSDSTTLFVPSATIVYAYSLSTFQQVGWTPNIFLPVVASGGAVGPVDGPALQAVDGTGLFAGPMEEGVGFIDTSALQTGAVGTGFTNAYLNPASGPLSGGTQTQWGGPTTLDKNKIYFGSQTATFDSFSGDLLTATTPEGSPGPADVYAYSTDGGVQIVPEGFSYGPTILEVSPNASTAEGGGTGVVFGYGLGPVTSSSIPTDLQITVGGKPAVITGFNPIAYGVGSPPFQLEAATYTIPAGTAGTSDVTVTNSIGTATRAHAMTYLPATQHFPLAGAQLVQGIYDPHNGQYYFTDANQVQVFSLSQGQWLSPIPIPARAGTTQRLWGIALSPDGSKLAISDAMAGVIYTLDPANPSLVATYSIDSSNPVGTITNPCGIAISDAGMVYFAVFVQGGDGFQGFFKLDTSNGNVTSYGIDNPGLGTTDANLRTSISSDNSMVYFNDDGFVFGIETATDKILSASDNPGCCSGDYDLTLAGGQQQFEASSFLYGANLNAESFYALNDREVLNISYVYGAKLDPDGSLLFQPTTNGIDVLDGRLGNLLTRIAVPYALSTNYDALVDDGTDNSLIAITGVTGNGIAVLNLNSISEPAPLPYLKRFSASAHLVPQPSLPSKASAVSVDARRRASLSHSVKHVTRPNFPRPR